MSEAAAGRAAFLTELHALAAARRADGQGIALLFVDCGVVGSIDTVFGYAAGDATREHFAGRLRAEVLRPQDALCELGRDEFALALDSVSSPGVALLAAEKVLRVLDTPVLAGDDEVFTRTAIGIALFPEHGADAATLLQHARTACRAARRRPGRVAMYAPSDEVPPAELLRSESRLRAAVLQEALDFLYRPQREFRTGLLAGADCVLGWRDGDTALITVHDAIAAAESARRVGEATRWVLNSVLRDCAELRQAVGVDLRVAVTLSARELRLPELPEFVAGMLKVWNLRPSRLSISVADTMILARRPETCEMLKRLRQTGVRLAIDDPAVGYASLAHLATLPFDEFRLDITSLRGLPQGPKQQAIARSTIGLAHELGLEVLAEGVDDEASVECLRGLGCDLMQGAHVGPPHEPESFAAAYGQ